MHASDARGPARRPLARLAMTYQVLARKWRPQTFETVVGQDAITRTIRNALASGRIAHAYLFAGPRGIGKTTTARPLATTDPRAIPPTVLSRVQRFDFHPIAPEALAATLEKILTEEKIPFEAGALPVIVRAAQGSLRDALSLLDTAIAYGDGQLEAEPVAALLGVTAPAAVRAFAAALIGHEAAAALEAIDRAAREGEDLQAFARDVIELLRRALVLKAAPAAKLADLTPAEGNELRKLGESVSLDELLYVLRAFLEAD